MFTREAERRLFRKREVDDDSGELDIKRVSIRNDGASDSHSMNDIDFIPTSSSVAPVPAPPPSTPVPGIRRKRSVNQMYVMVTDIYDNICHIYHFIVQTTCKHCRNSSISRSW